jgi:hypothetical protein
MANGVAEVSESKPMSRIGSSKHGASRRVCCCKLQVNVASSACKSSWQCSCACACWWDGTLSTVLHNVAQVCCHIRSFKVFVVANIDDQNRVLVVACRFLDVLGPGPLYAGSPSSDAITTHIAAASGATVRNDVKVRRRGSHML